MQNRAHKKFQADGFSQPSSSDVPVRDPISLIELFSPDLVQVDWVIEQNLHSQINLIEQIAKHLIFAGGKRLRPCLTLACASLFGPVTSQVNLLAAAVEFIHTATLLHDDVIDESKTRRNLPAAHEIWGNTSSILVGDFLFARAFELMVQTNHMDVLQILSRTAATISEGEVHQLVEMHNVMMTEETMMSILGAKTAQLFGAACQTGALMTGASLGASEELFKYGYYLGLIFQITDDVLDYVAKEGRRGKNVGDDFREGKVTLPVIYTYQQANVLERVFIEDCFAALNPTQDQFEELMALIHTYNGFDLCLKKAASLGEIALEALENFEESPTLHALEDAIHDCLRREV